MGISSRDIFAVDAPPGTVPGPLPVPPGREELPTDPLPALDSEPPSPIIKPRRSRKAMAAAGAGGVLLIAAVTYAVMMRAERDDAEAHASTLADENRDLSDAVALHRAGSIELTGKLETCSTELTEKKAAAETSSARVVALEGELAETRTTVRTLEQAETELASVTRQFQKMIDSGKLDVVFRRGQLIVKLPAKILFASGSAEISESGAAALREVAAILKPMRRKFTVAGHTDNVPISKPFKSNWDLSAARAVAVVNVLTRSGVRPRSLVAAGFGPYAPIATNGTSRGRLINRRIEIILEPDLSPAVRAVKRKKNRAKKK
jgi:chemotaxis protein MotB